MNSGVSSALEILRLASLATAHDAPLPCLTGGLVFVGGFSSGNVQALQNSLHTRNGTRNSRYRNCEESGREPRTLVLQRGG